MIARVALLHWTSRFRRFEQKNIKQQKGKRDHYFFASS